MACLSRSTGFTGLVALLAGLASVQAASVDSACNSSVSQVYMLRESATCDNHTNATCPSVCMEAFRDAYATCGGKSYVDPRPDVGTLKEFVGFELINLAGSLSPACEQTAASEMFSASGYATTCDDAASVVGGALQWCNPNTTSCISACMGSFDAFHTQCQADTNVTTGGPDEIISASDALATISNATFLNARCLAYLGGCTFGAGCATPAPTATPGDGTTTAADASGTMESTDTKSGDVTSAASARVAVAAAACLAALGVLVL